MRGPKPPVVELTPEEQQGLETLVRRPSTPQQLARRGRIILSAAAGLNNSQIARQVDLAVDTVRFWRNRWLSLACEAPSQSGRPISQWTSRELADEIIQQGIVERISPRHAARLLERGT